MTGDSKIGLLEDDVQVARPGAYVCFRIFGINKLIGVPNKNNMSSLLHKQMAKSAQPGHVGNASFTSILYFVTSPMSTIVMFNGGGRTTTILAFYKQVDTVEKHLWHYNAETRYDYRI